MIWIALKMLMGDKSKYFAITFGVSFACFLIAEQSATFCGIMLRTTSQIRDTHGADIWLMNTGVRYVDDVMAISDNDVFRVINGNNKLVRAKKVLVGQLLDVFIDTREKSE